MSVTVAPELMPLVRDPNGVMRVGNTRVTLDTVVTAFMEGMTAEAIGEQYPSLELGDVYTVIGYYLRHREEVEEYLRERQRVAVTVRQENEERFAPGGLRERLLARRAPQG